MANLGKRINIQKKFKKHPSSQPSGMPLKSIQGISDINSVKFKTARYTNTMTARPPAGTGTTPTAFPLENEKAQGAGTSNPFYIWLLNNSFTRTTEPINETSGSFARMSIIATGTPSYKITAGEKFYIYHPVTFKSLELTCSTDLTATDTLLRMDAASIQKGVDNFPSGSFLVKKYDVQSSHTSVIPVGSGNSTYLFYLHNQNEWYSSSAYSLSLGTSIGSELDSVALRSAEYISNSFSTVTSLKLYFYTNVTSDLEFGIYKLTLVDDDTSNITFTQMTHTDHDGSYTANTNYVKTFDITALNNLSDNVGVAILARSTSDQNVRIYGKGFLKVI